jgi:ubiquitin conjugation factor E4 A
MWVGECLRANAGRGKLWTSEMGAIMSANFVSDGFMLNLSGVLLQFCLPFTSGVKNSKLFKINPSYTACTAVEVSEDSRIKNVHLRDASKETCLVESVDPSERVCDVESFNFITDIFFITHKSMDLGLRVCHEKLVKINQELGRQQDMYREMIQQNVNAEQREAVQKRTDNLMTRYLSLKAALLLPHSIANMMRVISSTGFWLTNLAVSYGDKKYLAEGKPDIFPLIENKVALELKYVPEHLVENICEYLLLVKRFQPSLYEQHDECLSMIMDFVLPYMASPQWLKNPHLRARLAECLECLLPHHELPGSSAYSLRYNRERIFTEYKYRLEIIPCVLNVFVNIETTGQAVEFEMKFNYRRPMFEILKYVWKIDEYRAKMLQLANYAEEHILDEIPPLFLRFVNLLVNDATFLLDEALGYMKQIQEAQAARPQWAELPPNERTNRESEYMHVGRLARYHNIMGLDNIKMLDTLTNDITAVFTHSTMVDRIAAMLNYFLKTLVGPERKSLKVQNLEEFAFKPAEIVKFICKIYTHYAKCHSFLQAVSSDGRSYSPELFVQAKSVLENHIRDIELVESLQNVATSVKKMAADGLKDDELFADAPDEFLDPIMSHLMKDPVRLPNSGQIVDRTTIARHILSDQNDPFTRAPLTLDMVIPEIELKDRINSWMESKRREQS